MKPWERFLEKYVAFGEHPTRENHARLFASDATIFHPGMAAPMPAEDYVEFIQRAFKGLADYHLIPIHWAVNGDTVFVEARNTATVHGAPVAWPATYVVSLRGDMVVHGHAYYDRTEVLAYFEPELAEGIPNAHTLMLEGHAKHGASAADDNGYAARVYEQMVRPYAENGKHPNPEKFRDFYWNDAHMINPGFQRPLNRDQLPGYYTGLTGQIRNLQLRLERWAAAPGLMFAEWTVTGELNGKRLELPNTDRFTLRDTRAVEGVAYFDNLALRAMTDPKLARFNNTSFGNIISSDRTT